MEEGLLLVKEGEKTSSESSSITRGVLVGEMKRLGFIAAPMVAVTLSQYLLQVISTMMVGHLGELSLSSTAIATSLSGVTGYSFLVILSPFLSFSSCCCIFYHLCEHEGLISFAILIILWRFYLDDECSLEWWSFELLILLSGLLPNPELETSVLSVCLNTISTLYAIPYGFGAAVSTRVSNELGAGNPQGARVAVFVVMFHAVMETTIVSATLFAMRRIFGYTFSNEKEVVDYVTSMAPLVCLSVIMDSLQGVLSGVARGCGWQHIGAYVNLGAFYLVGIPMAATLAFWVQLRGKGLWIGIQAGAIVQTILLSIITSCTNWEKQAIKAKERLFEGRSSGNNGVM
ncbi:hypothetical protein RHGRI_034028 [Rhododendron griersonianum]|uniref:MATE efflux family protein n=1 Tax=Rhododendron griersonianum TaxID=479676 RepID=A0AAV6HYZ7_9ERIC|nr:hypothetical protein RHGRI_034028 [Rhododendron griersonianum]